MAKIDEVKEYIGYLKVLISIAIAVAISLIVWIFNHYEMLSFSDKFISFCAFIVDMFFVVFLNKNIIKRIKSLGDM